MHTMKSEAQIQTEAMLEASRAGATVFRNNVGVAMFPNGTAVRYGLCTGSSDLIGWKSVVIKASDVGKRIAKFVALEVKTPKGKLTKAQANFLRKVREDGGICGVIRSGVEAKGSIEE